jgi:hypothetical protein
MLLALSSTALLTSAAASGLQRTNPHMKAAGFYNQHSSWQAAAQERMIDDLVSAARTAALPMLIENSNGNVVPTPFRIADLGCSQGKNSLRPVNLVVQQVRQRIPSVPISVMHADLPSNDFSALFNTLNSPSSYTAEHRDVFPSAVGRSYYERLAPENQFHFVMAFVTLHWLPKVPSFGTLGWSAEHPLTPPATKTAVARQASQYLTDFLLQRAPEVVSGGKLLLSMVAADQEQGGGCQGNTTGMFSVLDTILSELNGEGVVAADQLAAFNAALYCRTEAEVRSVLDSDQVKELYTVQKVQRDFIELPQELQYKAGKVSLEEAVHASVASFQAVLEPSYLTPFQSNPRQAKVVQDEVRKRMVEKLLADENLVRFSWHHLFMSLTKK